MGFIPYQNLSLRYKFIAFESWLSKKGVDLTLYQQKVQNVDSIGSMDSLPKLGLDTKTQEENQQIEVPANSNLNSNFGDLFLEYQQEKDAFLSSFIGQVLEVLFIMKKCISLTFSPLFILFFPWENIKSNLWLYGCWRKVVHCSPCGFSFGGLSTFDTKKWVKHDYCAYIDAAIVTSSELTYYLERSKICDLSVQ